MRDRDEGCSPLRVEASGLRTVSGRGRGHPQRADPSRALVFEPLRTTRTPLISARPAAVPTRERLPTPQLSTDAAGEAGVADEDGHAGGMTDDAKAPMSPWPGS